MMGKYKVIFEGEEYIVLKLGKDVSIQSLIDKGFVIQKDGNLYTKDGKKVIISQRDFFRIAQSGDVYLTGNCGGSVFYVDNGWVTSNYHVLKCADKLIYNGEIIKLRKDSKHNVYFSPLVLPGWVWQMLDALNIDVYSSYDFGFVEIDNKNISFNTDKPYPRAVYTAGNCLSFADKDCLGIALAYPQGDVNDALHDLKVLKSISLMINCTYWKRKIEGYGIDVGTVMVNYGNGYARLYPALLIGFKDIPAIPGCSGSMVYPKFNIIR
jgi:hypothetical protein